MSTALYVIPWNIGNSGDCSGSAQHLDYCLPGDTPHKKLFVQNADKRCTCTDNPFVADSNGKSTTNCLFPSLPFLFWDEPLFSSALLPRLPFSFAIFPQLVVYTQHIMV